MLGSQVHMLLWCATILKRLVGTLNEYVQTQK